MKSIVLIGMMGSGKTTCGRLLARRLGREFLDTDAVIVEKVGMPISQLFATRGEPVFRDLETEVCQSLARRTDLVVATGGGMVLRPENVELLKKSGVLVFLNRPVEEIFDSTSMAGRPLAQGGREAFLETFARREPVYRGAADLMISADHGVEKTVDAIMAHLSRMEHVL